MATYVAVFALLLAYLALVAAYVALRTLAKLRRASTVLARGARGQRDKESLVEATTRHAELTAKVAEDVRLLRADLEQLEADREADRIAGGALRNVALVRYDAFSDLSGRMSFSLALLDDGGNGVAISAIAGSTDTRVYAKGVTGGQGEHELSPEEHQAVAAAVGKKRPRVTLRKAG